MCREDRACEWQHWKVEGARGGCAGKTGQYWKVEGGRGGCAGEMGPASGKISRKVACCLIPYTR